MRRAFTLAEVLIVIAIIGVIATVTLSALMNDFKKQSTITKLKTVHSMLTNLFDMSNAMNGGFYISDHDSSSTDDWFTNMISSNLHVTRYCHDRPGCWNGGTKMLDGSKPYWDKGASGIGDENTTFVTANGFMINMDGYRATNLKSKMGVNTNSEGVVLYIDINKEKKPNTVGKDVFVLTYTMERGLLPAGADKSDSAVAQNCKKTGLFCFEKIIRDNWSVDNLDL